jgi:hypothetical protein
MSALAIQGDYRPIPQLQQPRDWKGCALSTGLSQSPRLVFELTTGRYRMVIVKTAIEKPVAVKILGLERLVGVETLFDLMNARQSPRGSKEM